MNKIFSLSFIFSYSYSSSSNRYTFPSDGYFIESSDQVQSGEIHAVITGPSSSAIAAYQYMKIIAKYQITSTFVKKGTRIYKALATRFRRFARQPDSQIGKRPEFGIVGE